MPTPPDLIAAMHTADVGVLFRAIRAHTPIVLCGNTPTGLIASIIIPEGEVGDFPADASGRDRHAIVAAGDDERTTIIAALREYVDDFTGSTITPTRQALRDLLDRIECGES